MAPSIIISIEAALDHLQSCLNKYGLENYESEEMKVGIYIGFENYESEDMKVGIYNGFQNYKEIKKVDVISRLRCLRTFVIICSTKLGINVELMSLWARLDGVVCKIMDNEFSPDTCRDDGKRFFRNMEPFAEEINKWFIMLSDVDMQHQYPTLDVAFLSQLIEDLIRLTAENFNGSYVIQRLRCDMDLLRDIFRFATLVSCDEHQEVQDLYIQVEASAVRAAHYPLLHGFDIDDRDKYNVGSISSAFHDPQYCETYSKALACLKYCRDLHSPSLHDPITVMMDFIGHLLPESIQEHDASILNPSCLNVVFDGLRSLKFFLKKLPSMFHGEIIREVTRVAICDAGVTIFSIYKKDFDIDRSVQDFVGNMKVIQSKYEERLLIFPNPALLAFLDSDETSKLCDNSDLLRREPTIKLDLTFLRSLIGKLVESRKQQEDLHQALWILAVKVAFKFEFLIHRWQEVSITDSELYTMFLPITADMNIIKTESFKIFQDNTIEEDNYDIQDGDIRIKSIHSAWDHVQSFLDKYDYERMERIACELVMNRLRCLRTFVLCSTKFRDKFLLRTLLARLDEVISEIMYCEFSPTHAISKCSWFFEKMRPLDEEMDECFISLSYCNLQQCSCSPVANRVKGILDSLFENLEDFQNRPKQFQFELDFDGFFGEFEGRIDDLKDTITLLTNFITFASHMCADQHQEVRNTFSQIEALTLSASHVTVYLFVKHRGFSAYRMKSILSALELRIRPFQSPEFYAPTIHTKDDPLIAMMDLVDSLLSLLWNILLSGVLSQRQLEKLDSGLRSLKGFLRNHPNKFDDGKIRDMTRLAICDAGIIIFSLDQKDFDIDHNLQEFQIILKKVEQQVVPTSIMLGFLDFLVEYMSEVETSKFGSDTLNSVSTILEDLGFLRLLMGKLVELRDQPEDLHQALWNLSAATAYKMEFLIDQLVLGDMAGTFSTDVQSITEDMRSIRIDSMLVLNERRQEIYVQKITRPSIIDQVPLQSRPTTFNDFVGFKLEQSSVLNRLTRGSKELQVVAIVGMPGLGKTTLATKVYNETSVVYHFHVRAWCSVSQVFNKKKVLLELLNYNQKKAPIEYDTITEDDLAEELWRSLKGRRYIIFLDDVWDIDAYKSLELTLPDDSTGSRIILTTRNSDVAKLDIHEPVFLSHFTPEESLELLRCKVFPDQEYWPQEVQKLGIQISEICKGLPLTIVMVAGLLTASKPEVWGNVLQSLRSGMVRDQCERIIELSYNYLPDDLKRCFLSFAAFPEDHEISVKQMIWIWIAEGFVRKSESKSLEEAATDCLQNLIGRSLVMNARKRSIGGVRACRMHDLLRDFCLKKANEEFYMHPLDGKEEILSFDNPGNMRRLCIFSKHLKKSKIYCSRLRSLLIFSTEDTCRGYDVSFLFRIFKILRVLDVGQVYHSFESGFHSEIGFLVQLRYLVIQVDSEVNPSIGNLSNLETLIVEYTHYSMVTLPGTFWNLRKLRHLYSRRVIELPVDNLEVTCNLLDMDSSSTIHGHNWDILEKQLRKFPNIHRLNLRLPGKRIRSQAMSFSFLMHLESLNLGIDERPSHEYEIIFPKTIKKLTLDHCWWPWRQVSVIAGLPNLEVLKLLSGSFVGDTWHVEEEEFPKLKVLNLSDLGIVKWTAFDDQFQNLKKLVLNNCQKLEEIPECLENVASLELVEVIGCKDCISESIEKVAKNQEDMGNSVLFVDVRRDRSSE